MCDTVTKKAAAVAIFYIQSLSNNGGRERSILQEGSNFCKKTTKKIILSPNFQKVRFEMQK